MSNVIARPFSIRHDFRSIMWGATLQYNVVRAACAGLVLAIVMAVVSAKSPPGQGPPIGMLFALPLIWPIDYFIIMFPVSLVLGFLAEFLPLLGLVSIFYSIIGVTIGDPIVCILRRFVPRLVPVERPSFFSFAPIYWVLKPKETEEFAISAHGFDARRT